jgi:hypothetical protein
MRLFLLLSLLHKVLYFLGDVHILDVQVVVWHIDSPNQGDKIMVAGSSPSM